MVMHLLAALAAHHYNSALILIQCIYNSDISMTVAPTHTLTSTSDSVLVMLGLKSMLAASRAAPW